MILRKIRRVEQLAARRGPTYTSDAEPDEDEDMSLVEGRSRPVKQERLARRTGRGRQDEDEMEE